MDAIRIEGTQALDIAATVRRMNPGPTWVEVALMDAAGCKLRARRPSPTSLVEYAVHHSGPYGCPNAGHVQHVTVVPVVRDRSDLPIEAREVLARAHKRLAGMIRHGAAHDAVLATTARYDRQYAAALGASALSDLDLAVNTALKVVA